MPLLAPTPAPYPSFRSVQGSAPTTPPTIERLSAALVKADAAGNTADAQVFANALRAMKAEQQTPAQGYRGEQPPRSNKMPIIAELARRGKLPADKAALFAEAQRRGLVPGDAPAPGGSEPPQGGLAPAGGVTPELAQRLQGGDVSLNLEDGNGKPIYRGGGVENTAAGLNDVLYRAAGFPVDAARHVINWGIIGKNALTGQPLASGAVPEDSPGGHISIARAFEHTIGTPNPENVIPQNEVEKILRASGGGIGMAVAPEAVVGVLGKLGYTGERAAAVMGQIFGKANSVRSTAANAIAGGMGGAASQAGYDAAPEPFKPLAATLAGVAGGVVGTGVTALPGLAKAGGNLVRDFAAPMTQAGRERMAGQHLYAGATSPRTAISSMGSAPVDLVPGARPTTFQQTGDMGLGSMERAAATRDPAAFNQRRADQNTARVGALEGIQPTGGPEHVVAAVRQYMADIEHRARSALDAATSAAQGRTAALGQGRSPELAGADLRGSYEAARAAAKTQERALWQAVDPQGTLALPATATRSEARQIANAMPSTAKPMEGEEAAVFKSAASLGDVAKFSDITALQSRIKTEMRAEKIANGESPAYARLTRLNTAVQHDLESAIAQKVGQEQQVVAAGQMRPEDTFEAYLLHQQEAWFAERASRAPQSGDAGPGAISNGARRPASVLGVRGTAGQGSGGFSGAPSGPGIPPTDGNLAPNFDEAALGRLTAARDATRTRAETFDNKTLGPMRSRPSTTAPYDMPDSVVAARLFAPGPKSFDAIRTYRQAAGDQQAMDVVGAYAVDRLRRVALRDDGTLDPVKLAAFRRSHADALRALPTLDRALADAGTASEAMGAVADHQRQLLADANTGVLAKLLRIDDPHDVTRTVGGIFSRQDAATQMFNLKARLGNNAEAAMGLRKAVVDHIMERFVGNTEAGTSGVGTMKSDQFQTFIAQNKPALRAAGFTADEISSMESIAASLRQSNRSLSAVKIPGQSNTAQDTLAVKPGDSAGSTILKVLLGGASAGSGYIAFGGGLAGTAAAATASIGAGLVAVLRQNGLRKVDDLLREALLDPALAKALMIKATPGNVTFATVTLRQRMARAMAASALTPHGHRNAA